MPSFDVLESSTRSKLGGDDGGDDRIVLAPDFAGVLDGATSDLRVDGVSAGRFAADAGAAAIRDLPPDASLPEAARRLTRALAEALERAAPGWAGRRPSFAMILLSRRRRELWRIADCQYLIDGEGSNPGIAVDDVTARARALVVQGLLAAGRPVEELRREDPARAALAPLHEAQYRLINHPDAPLGYGVVDGTPIPARYLEVVPVPAGARELVLASDGYPRLRPRLDESEAEIARLRERDPLLIAEHLSARGIPPGREWYDDRTYLRLRLAHGDRDPS